MGCFNQFFFVSKTLFRSKWITILNISGYNYSYSSIFNNYVFTEEYFLFSLSLSPPSLIDDFSSFSFPHFPMRESCDKASKAKERIRNAFWCFQAFIIFVILTEQSYSVWRKIVSISKHRGFIKI